MIYLIIILLRGGIEMRIELGLESIEMTNVPDESELNQERVYYVYEWYIKNENKVFYVGKGTRNRYKNKKKNSYFNRILKNFECDVRFIEKDLTEYEALVLEEKMFNEREKEGHVMVNIITPNASGAHDFDKEFKYMKTPLITPLPLEKHYFGLEDLFYDEVKREKLFKTHFIEHAVYGGDNLYVKKEEQGEHFNYFEITKKLQEKVINYIENHNGKVF